MTDAPPMRFCIGCAQTDDHPRHVVVVLSEQGQVEVPWHMDCHAALTGCPTCTEQTEGAEGLRGDALRAHLTAIGD